MSDAVRILHVDDEPDLVEITAAFLEREDDRFDIEVATTASEGLDRLANNDVDCIVSDYEMPGQTGIEFLQAVREAHPNLPFILYTGKGSEEVASEAISAGVTDYLQKEHGTSQYAVLANRISNAVQRYRSQQAIEETEQKLSQLAEKTDDILFMFRGDWSELLFVNSAFEDIWGKPVEALEHNPQSFIESIHPEDQEKARQSMERLSNGEPDEIEYRVIRPDGERRWVLGQSKPIFDDDGNVARIVGFVRDITQRKERSRRLEAILNNTYTFVGLLDPDGTLLEANDTALSFGGLDQEDVVGKPLWDTYWAQSSEETRAIIRDAVEQARNGDLFRDEIRVQGSDRDAVIDFSIRPITNEQDEVTLLVPEGRDITERKKQDRKREQIIKRVTDAIVEVDSEWRFTLVNEQATQLYSMSAGDLLGENFWDVFTEARGTAFEEKYRRAMEERETVSFVEYYSGLDGWFDVDVYPRADGGLSFYFRDVTDRIERSHELERQNERFQYVEKVADIGYWEIDTQTPDPHDVTLSDGVYSVHDLSPDEDFDVEKGLQFYHPEDRPTVKNDVERAVSDGEPYSHEVRLITASGRTRWVHSVGEPIERDGEIVKVRGVFQDITKRKRNERELERQNQRLDEFASVVSHDLRNPLRVAEGNLELADEECDSTHLHDAANAVDRSLELIDNLLTLAREGDRVSTLEPVNLADVVEECWRNVETAEATLLTDTERTIRADQSRLQQLLENLMRNAVEHGGDDVTVTVDTREDDSGLYIEDDGAGITATARDNVFEAGYSTAGDGTGFGLTIVQEIIEAHGWEISVTDSQAGGARFEITGVEFLDC